MHTAKQTDWSPLSARFVKDPYAACDAMRETCAVSYGELLGWSVFRHADVLRVLNDPRTFSNAASGHRAVPNGIDPPEHVAYRRVIDPYFQAPRMQAFEPVCREIAADLMGALAHGEAIELMDAFAQPFAVRAQCGFLAWPVGMHDTLRAWTRRNQEAIRTQDRASMVAIASEFSGYMLERIRTQREQEGTENDEVLTGLLRARVRGRPLSDEELVSLLRNWTVGEISTLAASVGILAHCLAHRRDLQQLLRSEPGLLPQAIDEILRVYGPLVASRRITTQAVHLGSQAIPAGEQISLIWISANRDGRAFENPCEIVWNRDQSANLLYGAGIHACPGAPLARLELRVVMEEFLRHTTSIAPSPHAPAARAAYPASGFERLPLVLA
ncbi:MAG: cytochrome P450 [Phycisphaeraceae bacterium]|nr:cytochrome P450 [Phycisphaeraceae bacterium]